MTESAPLAPSNPYSATKAAAECIAMAYSKSFNVPIIITRSNNVYGPFQYPEKIIPKFICSLLLDKPCFIHGDGSNTRRYLYATDLAEAIALVLHKGVIGETYNIGSDVELSNISIAKLLLKQFNITNIEKYCRFVEDRAFNDKRYAIDSTKIQRLGWSPKVDFVDGIKKTVEWYRIYHNNWWDTRIEEALIAHPSRIEPKLK